MERGLIIQTPPLDVYDQMAADEYFCETMPGKYLLRFFNWEGSGITFGFSQRYGEVIEKLTEEDKKLKKTRRPTGGGIVLHKTDLTFSFIFYNPGEFNPCAVYEKLHTAINQEYSSAGIPLEILNSRTSHKEGLSPSLEDIGNGTPHRIKSGHPLSQKGSASLCGKEALPACRDLGAGRSRFPDGIMSGTKNYAVNGPAMDCFSKPVEKDLMAGGKKVLGGALRKFSDYMLYQASFQMENSRAGSDLHSGTMAKALSKGYGLELENYQISGNDLDMIRKLGYNKYRTKDWVERI